MTRCRLFGLVSLIFSTVAVASERPVEYRLSFANRAHHEARVEVVLADLGSAAIEVVMSRSSPGRYAIHNFAKNIYDVEATGAGGGAAVLERISPHSWRVSDHGGEVRLLYTLYGDHCDGTYVAIDRSHAHLNLPASLVWARGLEKRPARVALDLPPGWRVATQLPLAGPSGAGADVRPAVFRARDLQHLMDSPIEVSDHQVFEWSIAAPGSAAQNASQPTQTVRIALHHRGSEQELESFGRLAQAIVAEQIAVFGEPPAFDDGSYTFLADYLPWCHGDGMEHRNSTVLTSASPLSLGMNGQLGTLSHEFFHAWSIERLRPRSLEPFDFERANQSEALWFGEGFTSYYGPLMMKRAGVLSLDRFVESLSGTVNTLVNARGPRHRSPVEMSQQAPFVDDATSIDPTNARNNYLSYYSYGRALGLALDLELRQRGNSLDELFAELWQDLGRDEIPYTLDDLERSLTEVSGDGAFADSFFERYVYGREIPDFGRLLAPAGLAVRKARPGKSWLGGAVLSFAQGTIELESASLEGSPLSLAGLDRGDRILDLDGELPASQEELERWLDAHPPGEQVSVLVSQRGESRDVEIELVEDPKLEVVRSEVQDEQPSPRASREQVVFREAWLGAKSDHRLGHERHCPVCRRSFDAAMDFCPWDGTRLRYEPGTLEP